jgi:hypothetical protein
MPSLEVLKTVSNQTVGILPCPDGPLQWEPSSLLIVRHSPRYRLQPHLTMYSSTQDEAYHANLRRSVNSAFSMSALVQYEPFVDDTTEVFLNQTEKLFSSQNKVCDFAEWLQFYAFDVIGQITYSKRHGFVDRGEDVDGMVAYLGKLFSYVAPVIIPRPQSSSTSIDKHPRLGKCPGWISSFSKTRYYASLTV